MTVIPVSHPPMFSVPSMEKLALAMEEAVAAVIRMHTAHAEATEECSIVKYQLAVSKARLLAKRVEGLNAEQRDLLTKLTLSDPNEDLHAAELTVQRMHLNLELAKLQLDGLHYHLRIAEVSVRLASSSHLT